jgi:hypothetical protein
MLICSAMLCFGSRPLPITCGAMLLGSLALGCSGAGSPAPAAEASVAEAAASNPATPAARVSPAPAQSDVAPSPAGTYRGTYFVPVPRELEPYALFELDAVRVEVRDDELGLDYDLPELLLGEPRGLSFRGGATAPGEYRLEGDDGVARCQQNAGRLRCDEVFRGVELDPAKIDRLLEPMSDAEARARRSVADRFSIDPIGVLVVELSPRP